MPHILLVEDDEIILQIIKEMFEAEGWRVEPYAHGLHALSRINSQDPYDLLLLDNELPGLTGLELTRHARRLPHRTHTPVIILSASECGREARDAGANLFLKKPEGMKTLTDSVRRLLNP